MKLSLKNSTIPQDVYVALYGINNDTLWSIYNFSAGTLDVCYTGQTVAMDYMVSLGTGITIANLPNISSGIILISYNQLPNDFAVVADGNGNAAVQCPSFLSGTTDYNTVFNMVELTLSGSIYADITNVDFFSTPIEIHMTGHNNDHSYVDQRKGKMKYGRDEVFEKYEEAVKGTDYANLVVKNGKEYVRILAPQHGVNYDLIPTDYWDKYVNDCWGYYSGNSIYFTTTLGGYTGRTDGDVLKVSGETGALLYTYQKPGPNLAFDIFGCAGTLAAPNNEYGAIAARLGAAINRSVLMIDTQPDCDDTTYYKLTGSTNLYAAALHECYEDGTTYAFPFDDVCGGSSTLSCQIPGELVVTIL